jgi:hypothetical protein
VKLYQKPYEKDLNKEIIPVPDSVKIKKPIFQAETFQLPNLETCEIKLPI